MTRHVLVETCGAFGVRPGHAGGRRCALIDRDERRQGMVPARARHHAEIEALLERMEP